MARDPSEFTQKTKNVLAGRAGYMCSFPACRLQTICAHTREDQTVSVGVAAHIHAVKPGSARFVCSMTPEQRSHITNGIWMCQTHSRLIDTDEITYPAPLLKAWRADHETHVSDLVAGTAESDFSDKPCVDIKSFSLPDDLRVDHGDNRKRGLTVGLFPLSPRGIPIDTTFETEFRTILRQNPSLGDSVTLSETRSPTSYELVTSSANAFGVIPAVWRLNESGSILFVRSTEDSRLAPPRDNPGYWSIPDCIVTSIAVISTQLAFVTKLLPGQSYFAAVFELEATGMVPTMASVFDLPAVPTSGPPQRLNATASDRTVISTNRDLDALSTLITPIWLRILRGAANVSCQYRELRLYILAALRAHQIPERDLPRG